MISQELRESVTSLPTYEAYAAAFGELLVRHEEQAGISPAAVHASANAQVRLQEAQDALAGPQADHAAEVATASGIVLPHRLGMLAVIQAPLMGPVRGTPDSSPGVPVRSYARPSEDPFERATAIGDVITKTEEALPAGKQIAIAHVFPGELTGKGSARETDARYFVTTKHAFAPQEPTVRGGKRSTPEVAFELPEISCRPAKYSPSKNTIGNAGSGLPISLAVPQIEQLKGTSLQAAGVLRLGRDAVSVARRRYQAGVKTGRGRQQARPARQVRRAYG